MMLGELNASHMDLEVLAVVYKPKLDDQIT